MASEKVYSAKIEHCRDASLKWVHSLHQFHRERSMLILNTINGIRLWCWLLVLRLCLEQASAHTCTCLQQTTATRPLMQGRVTSPESVTYFFDFFHDFRQFSAITRVPGCDQSILQHNQCVYFRVSARGLVSSLHRD
jgi:hypothetical protein